MEAEGYLQAGLQDFVRCLVTSEEGMLLAVEPDQGVLAQVVQDVDYQKLVEAPVEMTGLAETLDRAVASYVVEVP